MGKQLIAQEDTDSKQTRVRLQGGLSGVFCFLGEKFPRGFPDICLLKIHIPTIIASHYLNSTLHNIPKPLSCTVTVLRTINFRIKGRFNSITDDSWGEDDDDTKGFESTVFNFTKPGCFAMEFAHHRSVDMDIVLKNNETGEVIQYFPAAGTVINSS